MDLIRGIHRNQYSADLSDRPECNVPFGNVGRPNCHVRAGANAQRQECARALVYVATELCIGSGVIQCGILKGILVGEQLDHTVKHLREGHIDQRVLFPHILARVRIVIVQIILRAGGVGKTLHIGCELSQNDLGIVNVCNPGGIPLQGDKAVVVDRGQRTDQILHRQVALAHKAVFAVLGVAHVNVLDVCTQVGNGRFGRFACLKAGVVHIPKRAQTVTCKAIQNLTQRVGMRKAACSFQKQRYAHLLRIRQQGGDVIANGIKAILAVGTRMHAHVGNAERSSQRNISA